MFMVKRSPACRRSKHTRSAYDYDRTAHIPISNVIMINDTRTYILLYCIRYMLDMSENTVCCTEVVRYYYFIFFFSIRRRRRSNTIIIICNIDCCGMMPRAGAVSFRNAHNYYTAVACKNRLDELL